MFINSSDYFNWYSLVEFYRLLTVTKEQKNVYAIEHKYEMTTLAVLCQFHTKANERLAIFQ